MRWFGPEDAVTIRNIQQTPVITNIITALHPAGEAWTESETAKRKLEVEFLLRPDEPTDLDGMTLNEEAVEAARKAENDKAGRKIAFIKVPFAFGERGVCADLK